MNILGMGSANERRRYIVTLSLTGWSHTQNDICIGDVVTTLLHLSKESWHKYSQDLYGFLHIYWQNIIHDIWVINDMHSIMHEN